MPSVDERIVQMEFDNAQFEQGVKESLHSLDNLEKALLFPEGTTGLSDIANAVKNISFGALETGLEKISDKFSVLGTIGRTVVQNLTNDAVDALQKIPNLFGKAIEQIKTGGWNRAANLEQARFMLKGLTDDANKVEEIINGPVMKAVNATRFGLDEAAVAASNLYASGISDMDKLEQSLQAISGAATMTNKEYGDMADIFSTVASNGFLMTMQVRQFSTYGMNVLALLRDYLKESKGIEMSEQEIGDGLKDGLITYEMFAEAMHKYWKIASEANTTYSGSLANVKAQLSKIGAEVAGVYMEKMIGVNVALIDYFKALKDALAPIFTIINDGIIDVTKSLADFISSSKTMKITTNIIETLVILFDRLHDFVTPIGEAMNSAFPTSLLDFFLTLSTNVKKAAENIQVLDHGVNLDIWKAFFEVLKFGMDTLRTYVILAKPVFDVLLAFGDAVITVFGAVARKIGEVVKAINDSGSRITMAERLAEALQNFLPDPENIRKAGDVIANFIDNLGVPLNEASNLLDNIKGKFDTLSGYLSAATNTIIGFVGKIANAVVDAFNMIHDALVNSERTIVTIGNVIGGVFKGLFTLLSPVFKNLGKMLNDFAGQINFETITSLLRTGGLIAIADEIYNLFNKINSLIVKTDLVTSLKNVMFEATKSLEVLQRSMNASIIKQMAVSLAILAGSLFLLALVDSDKLKAALDALTGAMIELFGAFAILSKLGSFNLTGGGDGGLLGKILGPGATNAKIFANLLLLASAMLIVAGALKTLASIDPDSLAIGLVSMIVALLILITAMKALDILFEKTDPAKIAALGGAMLVISIAIQVLAGAVALFALLPITEVWQGLITMGIALAAVIFAMQKLADIGPMAIVGAGAMMIMALAMNALAAAVAVFSKLPISKVQEGLVTMGVVLAGLVIALAALAHVGPMVLAASGAILMVSAAIGILTLSIVALTALPVEKTANTLLLLGLALTAVSVAVGLLSLAGPMALAAGGALLIASVGILALAASLAVLSAIPADKLAGAIGSLAGALGILLASALLATFVAPGLGALSLALLALGAASILAGVGMLAFGAGMTLLATGLTLLATADIAKLPGIFLDLSAALLLLGPGAAVLAIFSPLVLVAAVALGIIAASVGLAALGLNALAAALENFGKVKLETVATNIGILSEVIARFASHATSFATIALGFVRIADSMEKLYHSLPYVSANIKSFQETVSLMATDINNVSFDAFIDAFDKLVDAIGSSQQILEPVERISYAMQDLAGAAEIIAPLTDNIVAMATGMETLYSKSAPAGEKLKIFVNTVQDLQELTEAITFQYMIDELEKVIDKVDEMTSYNDQFADFSYTMGDFAEKGMALSEMSGYLDTMAKSIVSLKTNAGATATNLTGFSEQMETLSSIFETISFQTLIDECISLIEQIDILIDQEDPLYTLSQALGDVAKNGIDMKTASEYLSEIAETVKYVSQYSEKAASEFTDFVEQIRIESQIFDTISFEDIKTEIKELGDEVYNTASLSSELETFSQKLGGIGSKASEIRPLAEYFGDMVSDMGTIVRISSDVVSNINSFVSALNDASSKLKYTNYDGVAEKWKELAESISASADDVADSLHDVGAEMVSQVIKGMHGKVEEARNASKEFFVHFTSGFTNIQSSMQAIGENAVKGFISGLRSNRKLLYDTAYNIGVVAEKAAKKALDEHSPSKVFYKIGSFAVKGFINGVDKDTAAGRKKIESFFTRLIPAMQKLNPDLDLTLNLKTAQKKLEKYKTSLDNITRAYKTNKESLKQVNRELKLYSNFESSRNLSKSQITELNYLRTLLDLNGTLTDKQFKRYTSLLGLQKSESVHLNNLLVQRKNLSDAIDKNHEKMVKYKALAKELQNEIKDGQVASYGSEEKLLNSATVAVEKLAEQLYKQTDDYKENTQALKDNKAEKKDIKDNILPQLTEAEEKYSNRIAKANSRLKEMLVHRKASKKLSKDEQKELDKLQEKMRKGKALSDEEIDQLIKLLGLKGEEKAKIEGVLKARADEQESLDAIKESTSAYKDRLKELTEANKELRDAIKNGPTEALNEFANTVMDNVSNALDPLNEKLTDSIDFFSKFKPTELSEGITTNGLIANLASFGKTYKQWEDDFAKLSTMGFNDLILNSIRELGPAGEELVRMYLTMTKQEIEQANAAMLVSTEATMDEWLTKLESKAAQQRQFLDDLNALLARGLSEEAYDALLTKGAEAAGGYVDGLLSGPKENIDRVNAAYTTYAEEPAKIAAQAMAGAAAAAQNVGESWREALTSSFDNLMTDEDWEKIRKTLNSFVEVIASETEDSTEDIYETGEDTGEAYAEGVEEGISSSSYYIYEAAESVGSDANDGITQYISKSNGEVVGKQMDAGLVAGLNSDGGAVASAARAVAAAAYAAAMSELGIASPSKKFAEIGMYADLGLAKGLSRYASVVDDASRGVAGGSLSAVRDAIASVSDTLEETDNSPVIKPILDLSNVEAGAITMKRMFDSAHINASADDVTIEGEEGANGSGGNSYVFNQYNNSPKALSRIDIYRQTKNQFAMLKGATT